MADKKNGSPTSKAPGALTKKGAVRLAMKDLGKDAKPTQLHEHIKQRYHIDMDLNHISTCKGEILRETGQAKSSAGKATPAKTAPAARPAGKSTQAHVSGAQHGNGVQGISLRDIETIKDLVERVGAPNLKRLIEVMAR